MKSPPLSTPNAADAFASLRIASSHATPGSTHGESRSSSTFDYMLGGGGAGGFSASMSVDKSTDDWVAGPRVILINRYTTVCCGAVGGKKGTSFCVETNCSIDSHRTKRSLPEVPTFFFLRKSGLAYVEPAIAATCVPTHEHFALVNKEMDFLEWSEEAELLNCAHELQKPVEVVTSEVKEARVYKTPTKDASLKRLATTLAEDDARFTNSSKMPRLSVATHRVETYLENVESGGRNPNEDNNPIKVLGPVLVELAQQLDNQTDMLSAHAERGIAIEKVRKGEGTDVNIMLGGLRVDVNLLRALVGKGQEVKEYENESLCGALRMLHDDLTNTGVLKLGTHTGEALGKLEVAPVLERFSHAINDLSGRVGVVERTGNANSMFGGTVNPQVPNSVDEGWKTSVEDRLTDLKTEMSLTPGASTDASVNLGGHVFGDMGDFSAWLEAKEGVSQTALIFVSWPIIYDRIYADLSGDLRDIKEAKAISDMNFRDYDARAAQAMSHSGLPTIFAGKNRGVNTVKGARFGAMPTQEHFGEIGRKDGLRHRALLALDRVVKNITFDIQHLLKDPEVKSLASMMLLRTADFIRANFQYIGDTYYELIPVFENSDQTWDFVCYCVEQILTTEFSDARAMASGLDFRDPNLSKRMMWVSMRIVMVQEKFMEVGIANHSSLSGAYCRFLIKNSQNAEVAALKTKVEKYDSQFAKMNQVIDELRSRVKSAESTADRAWSKATSNKK